MDLYPKMRRALLVQQHLHRLVELGNTQCGPRRDHEIPHDGRFALPPRLLVPLQFRHLECEVFLFALALLIIRVARPLKPR